MSEVKICYCDLTSDFHVLEDGDSSGCELHEIDQGMEFTVENVKDVLRFYAERGEEERRKSKECVYPFCERKNQ